MTEQTNHTNANTNKSDEIDLIEVARKIWDERRLIYKTVAIFFALGLLIAFGSTKEYKSEAKLLPEAASKEGGTSGLLKQFGGLGALAGIDMSSLGGGVDAFGPQLYPNIIHSTPFMLHLLDTRVDIPSLDTTATVYAYMTDLKKTSLIGYIKKFTIGLPFTILKLFRSSGDDAILPIQQNGLIKLTKKQSDAIKNLQDRIVANVDDKSGVITISTEFPDPVMAAQLAEKTVHYLTSYITEYRLEKVKGNLDFIREQHAKAKKEFVKAQENLADFRDRNKNIVSARVKSEEDRLQAQYNLAFNVYNSLSQQLQQAEIKVQEETPVFKVLNPVQVPVENIKPRKIKIFFSSLMLGVLFGIGIILLRNIFNNLLTIKKKNTINP
jgi:uncharacterized protein involved in exopolysaccharide biosynthesis